jgi:RimJ/RimL family protein N-acetyltransferase
MADGFARGLERIWAGTDLENKASERVMRRLGMRFDRREVVNGLPQVFYVIERGAFRA